METRGKKRERQQRVSKARCKKSPRKRVSQNKAQVELKSILKGFPSHNNFAPQRQKKKKSLRFSPGTKRTSGQRVTKSPKQTQKKRRI